jgi:hypothetical protein
MTADVTTDLLIGMAEDLDERGIAVWSGEGSAVTSTGGLPGVALRQLAPQPAFIVCLTDYGQAMNAKLTDQSTSVNVRIRSDAGPGKASLIAQQITNAWHALGRYRFGIGTPHELRVTDVQWQSETALGPDTTGRHERSVNFLVLLNRPGTTRE